VRNVTEQQLDFITLAGGVLGAAGGLVIWDPYLVLVLPVLGGAVWGLDVLLSRRRPAPFPPAPNPLSPPPPSPPPAL
jgi:hypothetical protein